MSHYPTKGCKTRNLRKGNNIELVGMFFLSILNIPNKVVSTEQVQRIQLHTTKFPAKVVYAGVSCIDRARLI